MGNEFRSNKKQKGVENMTRIAMYGIIAVIGLVFFIAAVLYLPIGPDLPFGDMLGHNAELVTLFLGPLSGICLAIIMHFGNLSITITSFKCNISFVLQDGGASLRIKRS
ncbi:MAG: hypothetical protein ISS66_05190 [Desulfobacteraceae bacterium]|nr:hypothetical protein [Desulfobacteraceae bacterium]